MTAVTVGLFVTTAYPLFAAFRESRGTTLPHALAWVAAAWVAWGLALFGEGVATRYLALVLTACAGVAVLEPRRPGVVAWHVVPGGLFCVLMLPLAQGWGRPNLSPEWALFLATVLAVSLVNYLPTRLAPAALLLLLACGGELLTLLGRAPLPASRYALAAAPWAGWLAVRLRAEPASEFDRVWLGFRDRFGGLWALRTREAFARAAENAGWSLRLGWRGAAPPDDPLLGGAALETLRALLKRFGDQGPPMPPAPPAPKR